MKFVLPTKNFYLLLHDKSNCTFQQTLYYPLFVQCPTVYKLLGIHVFYIHSVLDLTLKRTTGSQNVYGISIPVSTILECERFLSTVW